jgi:hypothetical protein
VQEAHLLKESDHRKIGKEIAECIEAKIKEKGRFKAEEKLRDALGKWTRKKPFKNKDPLSATADLGACLWHSMGYNKKKITKGKVKSKTVADNPYGYDIEYCVWAPSKYRAKSGPYPLVLCIPEAGQRTFDHLIEDWALGDLRSSTILAAVSMPEDVSAWTELGSPGKPGGYANLMLVFKEVTQSYAVDFDQIFLAGKGAGVAAALQLAEFAPDRFAGVIGRTGDAGEVSHENFRNLPVFFAGGGQQATAFAEAMEEAGFAEAVTRPEALEEDVLAWILATRRRSYPQEISLRPRLPFPNKAYWLEIPHTEEVEGRMIHGKLDPATNEITITAKHVSSVTIYFNDLMLDLDLPVTVVCNGVRNEDVIPRNFTTMMHLIYSGRNDAGRFYTASRVYDIPRVEEEDEG